MKTKFHPYHVLDYSPWPVVSSLNALSIALFTAFSLSEKMEVLAGIPFLGMILSISLWWRDVVSESLYQGHHTHEVVKGLRLGVLMFILSEVMFFFSIFYAFFFTSLSPDVVLGSIYPPAGVSTLDIFSVPLLNTVILLSSGISLTWSHHSILSSQSANCKTGLLLSILLGFWFIFLQKEEYFECSFSMADSVFGSLFFLSTGFHGFHVMVGVIFLSVSVIRLFFGHFSSSHCVGYEASAWYWHFVDVVWLFLYVSVYWWGM